MEQIAICLQLGLECPGRGFDPKHCPYVFRSSVADQQLLRLKSDVNPIQLLFSIFFFRHYAIVRLVAQIEIQLMIDWIRILRLKC